MSTAQYNFVSSYLAFGSANSWFSGGYKTTQRKWRKGFITKVRTGIAVKISNMKKLGYRSACNVLPAVACAMMMILLSTFQCVDAAFDPLDPSGNITIKWDITAWTGDGYLATVTLFNWQQYRHIDPPGWQLTWTWPKTEVIWAMQGAQTTSQGDCSQFRVDPLPHCCDLHPVVVDLLPSAPYTSKLANCCKGGVLPAFGQDPDNARAAFQLRVGLAGTSNTTVKLPQDFRLLESGYTCSPAVVVENSQFADADGRRVTEAFLTWNVTCSYSQALATTPRSCCVSFSAFYNDTIVPCAECSCACQPEDPTTRRELCIDPNTRYKDLPNINTGANVSFPVSSAPHVLYCTHDMCPVKIHWHVKTNYKEYWRVKVTVTNRDFSANFTNWNLVLKHPNFRNFTEAFSFKYKALNPYGPFTNDSAMFWGVKYYNEYLLQAGPDGNVQSDILFQKDADFTLKYGWAFPEKVYFNGDQCVLPGPQDFPSLPSSSCKSWDRRLPPILLVLLVSSLVIIL